VGNFDDNRGDDLSLHLVDRDNNPFNAFNGVIDKSTFTMDGPFATGGFAQTPTREVAAAGRAATGFNAIRDLEALMVQGARPLEVQRELTRDDLHGMSYLQSGPDQLSGGRFAADDYVFSLVFNAAGVASAAGAVPAGVQILVNNIALAPPLARTVFARPFASAIVEYDIDDETGQAIAQTDIWLDGPLESTGTTIQFVDVTLYDAFGPTVVQVPEPATMGLVAAGLMTLARRAWRRGRGNARR
ncbi:MAG: PEP-CTERM sorting domain-containing protein, partial [Betaproteobacteria bacterium]|nr:PEP-CTERM sorting domain-containing protein [Betaproteobacteria bacterium]